MNGRRHLALVGVLALLLAGCVAPTTVPHYPDLGDGARANPATDRQGWEGGYWYNESLAVDAADGLNASERHAVVERAMARVEHLRGVEFDRPVRVSVVSRSAYRERLRNGSGGGDNRFHDALYEALFLVGEGGDAGQQQRQNREVTVQGYYSPSADRIVVISNSETPTLTETTLGHELVHAYQFRHLDPSYNESTLELFARSRALIEGDARLVGHEYRQRCEESWSCLRAQSDGGSGNDSGTASVHYGLTILSYFPYSDGPGFVRSFRQRGGWDRVNALYDAPPASSEQVVTPRKYHRDAPRNVTYRDRSSSDWERVDRPGTPDYGSVGMAGMTAMFAYPSYDDSRQGGVVSADQFLNLGPNGTLDDLDPIDYNISYVRGWDGDKLVVYRNGSETGYVWKSAWDSPQEAREFATGYRRLLRYWGGNRTGDAWRIDSGPFADAFRVTVEGDTVTVVNAPTVADLDGVRRQ